MTTTTTDKPTSATAAPKPVQGRRIDPSKLAPDFDNLPGEVVSTETCFWLGITEDIGIGQIDKAGLHFPYYNEAIETNNAGDPMRTPQVGCINRTVNRHKFDALCEILPRLVIRFEPDREVQIKPGVTRTVRRAKLLTIPTEAQIAGATTNGQRLRPYVKQPGDRPASEFLFFHHAPTGHRGPRGSQRPISETGLEWPESANS